jgi:hypothetical protein
VQTGPQPVPIEIFPQILLFLLIAFWIPVINRHFLVYSPDEGTKFFASMKNYLVFLFLLACFSVLAQGERKDKTAITYEEIYDEPYSVNKLFIGFQPMYGELFVTNVNAGFGIEASYYLSDKADFRVMYRKPYSQRFFDFTRDQAENNSDVDNKTIPFGYLEAGATYHFRDFESSGKTKMFLYKKSYKGDRWAARVPLSADIPCKIRRIYGGRIGVISWKSTVNLSRVLEDQGLTNDDLKDSEGNGLPLTYMAGAEEQSVDVFSSINSLGGYVGGSIAIIKNVAVDIDKHEEGIDDLIFTAYFDVLFAASNTLDDVFYTTDIQRSYSVSPVKTSSIGFRLGIDGKFNRMLSWSYGGELGMRPGLSGSGFYALLKISFPVFGTNLDYKVESFGK